MRDIASISLNAIKQSCLAEMKRPSFAGAVFVWRGISGRILDMLGCLLAPESYRPLFHAILSQHINRHDFQRLHVGRVQVHLWRAAFFVCLQEPTRAKAPTVAGV